MTKKIHWITQTAILLALLVTLQSITKPMGQLVTGSCVNAILAISAMFGGLGSGLTVALISPVLAFLLGIAPQIITVPAIMAGNAIYVVLLYGISGKSSNLLRQTAGLVLAAAAKFAVLYLIVVKLMCGILSESLLSSGTMKAPMLKALPVTFSWPQLFTALLGGAIALAIIPVLKKAVKK